MEKSPFYLSFQNEIFRILFGPKFGGNVKTPLHTACKAGNFDAVVALVKGGANINATRSKENITRWNYGSSLDWAAHELTYKNNPKNLDLVEFLVENGATRSFHSGNEKLPCPVIQGFLQSKQR